MCFTHLSINCFLETPSHVSTVMRPVVTVPTATAAGVAVARLRALLDRVCPICSLAWFDSSDLMDLDLGFWRVLDVHVHQRGEQGG